MCQEDEGRSKKILQDYEDYEAGKLGDDSQNEKTVVDRPTVKHSHKAPKSPEFVDTDSDDSDDEKKPAVKQLQKVSKVPVFVDTDSSTEDEQEPTVKQPQKAPKIPGHPGDEDHQETFPGPVHKETAKPAKKLPAASCTPATSCTYILTSGVRKGKQCRFKASDERGKFCHYHKQT